MVGKDQGHHRLNNRHGSGKDTRIVPSPALHDRVVAFGIHRFLRLHNRRRWLEGRAYDDILAVANAALDST